METRTSPCELKSRAKNNVHATLPFCERAVLLAYVCRVSLGGATELVTPCSLELRPGSGQEDVISMPFPYLWNVVPQAHATL